MSHLVRRVWVPKTRSWEPDQRLRSFGAENGVDESDPHSVA
jgi:hypothetical protein